MQAGKWAAAESALMKAVSKDSLNVEAYLLLSRYFFSTANPRFNIDSAYSQWRRADAGYRLASPRQRDRLSRSSIDSARLLQWRFKLDSAGFARAKMANSEEAYQLFLDRFGGAREQRQAEDLRNEAAFLEALRQNKVSSFESYLARYPGSLRAAEAQLRLDELLYRELTQDKQLGSYEKFLRQYPQSSFRIEVEQNIFELATAPGQLTDFLGFLDNYPQSPFAPRARYLAYALAREHSLPLPPQVGDSLRAASEQRFWVPFLKNERFGFMDENGAEAMPARFETLRESRCGPLTRDFFSTSAGLYLRSGKLLWRGEPDEVRELSHGFVLVKAGACVQVLNKGFPFPLTDCLADVRVVANRFLAVQKAGMWGVYAFNGRSLLPHVYREVASIDDVMVLVRNQKKILVTANEVSKVLQGLPLAETQVFDEVSAWGEGHLLVRNGALEGVLTADLTFLIPLQRQLLRKTSFGFVAQRDMKLTPSGLSPTLDTQLFDQVRPLGEWVALAQGDNLRLWHVPSKKMADEQLDSLWLEKNLLFSSRNDSIHLYVRGSRLTSFHWQTELQFIKSADSLVYFFLTDKKKKLVYQAATGALQFSIDCETLEHAGGGRFVFAKGGKKGLVSDRGKMLLPPQYTTMVRTADNHLALLKDGRFGLYNLATGQLIEAGYQRNLLPYAPNIVTAYRDGKYGFISASQQALSAFDFDEIVHWTDSSALVRRNLMWQVFDIYPGKTRVTGIRSFQFLKNTPAEKIIRWQKDNFVGVMSSTRGTVIPPTFTEILNLGTDQKHLYFTEKEIEEAGIFVVIYYNADGKFIRKQVYEAEEYEKIYCDE